MPISKENKHLYPDNWPEIRARILARAKNQCEKCGVVNHSEVARGPKCVEVVLTIAHLDHNPTHNEDSNLRAYCQQCHNRHDAQHRAETRRAKKIDPRQIAIEEVKR